MVLAAPYPGADGGVIFDLVRHPLTTIGALVRRAVTQNAGRWLSWRAEWLEIVFRYELLVLGLVALVLAIRSRHTRDVARLAFVASSAGLLIMAVLLLGELGTWQDYRTITPVLLALWLIAGSARPNLLWVSVGAHAAVAPVCVATFLSFQQPRFDVDRVQGLERFGSQVSSHVQYDPALPPWGNSVLLNAETYQSDLLGLPHGIGVSAVLDWQDLVLPPRSRYLLLRAVDLDALGSRVNLRRVGDTTLGTLYENVDWRR
jgi:hypothetical protein